MSDDDIIELIAQLRAMARCEHEDMTVVCDAVAAMETMRSEVASLRADRRERIATACLAGKLACSETRGNVQELSESAVRYADALIRALNKKATQ